jgi:hypothetical protein
MIDDVFRKMAGRHRAEGTLIVCFYTGDTLPSSCAAMPRSPAPATGVPFDQNFPKLLAQAIATNPAVHDGATMVGRSHPSDVYVVTGWSFRLFPDAAKTDAEINRGSAFNSCFAMSFVRSVDCVYLLSGSDLFRFEGGAMLKLHQVMSPKLSH